MDSDFHYYGTGSAALASGFNKTDAALIANVAQYVDWFHSDYWSYWYIVNKDGSAIKDKDNKQFKYTYPQISAQNINWKMIADYDENIWNTFHFPPGNLPYSVNANGWEKAFNDQHKVRKTNLSTKDINKLCRPFSKFAYDMIHDTIIKFKLLSEAKGDELTELVSNLVAPRQRCPVTDGRKMALYFLGVRMHVLSDTWAHQDFTGEQNENINAAGILNSVYAKDDKGVYQETKWTGTFWALNEDTDCAAAPTLETNIACAGHGQMGHFPDYSWMNFKYPAAWLPIGDVTLERENSEQYNQAWSWISFVMELCNGNKANNNLPTATPDDIKAVISTWHKLSTESLDAVSKSEMLWENTVYGRDLPKRWDPERRDELGLYNGLAITREGYINIIQNSTLHYMETASSMHYKFCVDWIVANPEYTWVPEPALT